MVDMNRVEKIAQEILAKINPQNNLIIEMSKPENFDSIEEITKKIRRKKIPFDEKIKEIRDTQIAHFDDIKLDYRLELIELSELIDFCQETYNKIAHSLKDSSIYWKFSDSEMFNSVVINLNKYSKIKNLFFKNLASMNEKIETSELSKIIKANSKS
jgi:hypothetical protein